MAEYIERDIFINNKLIPLVKQLDLLHPKQKKGVLMAIQELNNEPAADVVEVVRCKDCMYYEPKNSLGTQGICQCGEMEMNYGGEFYPLHNDFCSYGEKRSEGDAEKKL